MAAAQKIALGIDFGTESVRALLVIHASMGRHWGAAILGTLAAGPQASGFQSAAAAIRAMAEPRASVPARRARVVKPNRAARDAYQKGCQEYLELAQYFQDEGK